MKKLVKVTQEDIDRGIVFHRSCPVALALNRTFNDIFSVRWNKVLYKLWVIPLPRSATRFIGRFDEKMPVKPFNFYFNCP